MYFVWGSNHLMSEGKMFRNNRATSGRRRCLIVLGTFLVLLVLAKIDAPPSQAGELDYQGGLVRIRRSPDPYASRPSVPKTAPPSYFPDNDDYYPSFSGERGAALPPSSAARILPFNISPASLPWNQVGFVDYDELQWMPQEASLSVPKKYVLQATALSPASPATRSQSALLIVHLPEHAVIWVEGKRTLLTGENRYFHSPQLSPGRRYSYTVRAAWIEGGQWVSQTRIVPVQAGMVQAIYIRSLPGSPVETKRKP
jgi:uncharacterized protein (TIGR03000 family)